MGLNGIDISDWQRDIWIPGVEGDFVIVKATGGTHYVSPSWRWQADQVLESGKLLGFYHYAMEYGEYNSPWDEARHFLDTIADYKGKCLLALDFEADAQSLPVSWARQWMDIVEQEWGVKPVFYAYASYQQP
jgi:GH25 family lysozyme M1 (1,4-beta-N-acetylmuramidase)